LNYGGNLKLLIFLSLAAGCRRLPTNEP